MTTQNYHCKKYVQLQLERLCLQATDFCISNLCASLGASNLKSNMVTRCFSGNPPVTTQFAFMKQGYDLTPDLQRTSLLESAG